MEPMALGSPGGSPATAGSFYLPEFLMGESNPGTPRNSTLSPTKVGRSVQFANHGSPAGNITSPIDFNRSNLNFDQRSFNNLQDTSTRSTYPSAPQSQAQNTPVLGPPKQGLFDLLKMEQNQIQTPVKNSYGFQQTMGPGNQSFNDSYFNHSNFNNSRISSPQSVAITSPEYQISSNHNNLSASTVSNAGRHSDFWVTVFGFPENATSMILKYFSQCGTIVDKVFPTSSGNWVHLKYSSRLECDKALNYNEKILGNNIMIGVTSCKDTSIASRKNLYENQISKVRPLAQVAYNTAQTDSSVITSPTAPQKSSGIVNKAMDLLFGW